MYKIFALINVLTFQEKWYVCVICMRLLYDCIHVFQCFHDNFFTFCSHSVCILRFEKFNFLDTVSEEGMCKSIMVCFINIEYFFFPGLILEIQGVFELFGSHQVRTHWCRSFTYRVRNSQDFGLQCALHFSLVVW